MELPDLVKEQSENTKKKKKNKQTQTQIVTKNKIPS